MITAESIQQRKFTIYGASAVETGAANISHSIENIL
jgi:hypothetical protein